MPLKLPYSASEKIHFKAIKIIKRKQKDKKMLVFRIKRYGKIFIFCLIHKNRIYTGGYWILLRHACENCSSLQCYRKAYGLLSTKLITWNDDTKLTIIFWQPLCSFGRCQNTYIFAVIFFCVIMSTWWPHKWQILYFRIDYHQGCFCLI